MRKQTNMHHTRTMQRTCPTPQQARPSTREARAKHAPLIEQGEDTTWSSWHRCDDTATNTATTTATTTTTTATATTTTATPIATAAARHYTGQASDLLYVMDYDTRSQVTTQQRKKETSKMSVTP